MLLSLIKYQDISKPAKSENTNQSKQGALTAKEKRFWLRLNSLSYYYIYIGLRFWVCFTLKSVVYLYWLEQKKMFQLSAIFA